jgi:hypothetical protein
LALFSGISRLSTVPAGSLAKAASVGAKTVNGPAPFRVSLNPAALMAATNVLNCPALVATSMMFPPARAGGALCCALVVLLMDVDALVDVLGVALDDVLGNTTGAEEAASVEPRIAVLASFPVAPSKGSAAAGAAAGTAAAAAALALVLEGPALLTLARPAMTKKLVMQIAVVVKLGLNLAVMGVVL